MLRIQFNFDEATSEISDLTVIQVDQSTDNPLVYVEDNKLKLSSDACNLMHLKTGDRIEVNYYTVDEQTTFPVIGKSEIFTDKNGGNRLTKSNTVSFRGSQRDILLEYGNLFKLVPFNNYYKMEVVTLPSENDDLSEEEQDLKNLN